MKNECKIECDNTTHVTQSTTAKSNTSGTNQPRKRNAPLEGEVALAHPPKSEPAFVTITPTDSDDFRGCK